MHRNEVSQSVLEGAGMVVGRCRGWHGKWFFQPLLPPLPALVAAAFVIAVGASAGTSVASLRMVPVVYEKWLLKSVITGATLAVAGSAVIRLRWSDRVAWLLCLLALGLTVFAWGWCRGRMFTSDDLAWSLGERACPVAVAGRIKQGPELCRTRPDRLLGTVRGSYSELLLELTEARHHDTWRPVSGRARVFVNEVPAALQVGTLVRVYGRGLRPTPALNPGEYDFAEKVRRERTLSLVRVRNWSSVVVEERSETWSIQASIDHLRATAANQITQFIKEPQRPLASALLLGRREGVSQEILNRFATTGTGHLLAISGLHLGILAAAVTAILHGLSLSRRMNSLAVGGVVTIYAMIVGDAVPVWRATILIWAGCLAIWIGRRTGGLRPLALAAGVLLVWNPASSLQVGTQLSFLATAVLTAVGPRLILPPPVDPIKRLLDQSRPLVVRVFRLWIRRLGNLALAGLAVWIMAAPLVADSFQRVSPIAVGLNLFLTPLVSIVMVTGFCCLFLGSLLPTLGGVSGGICGFALSCLDGVVTAFAGIPLGSWRVASPPFWWLMVWYLLVMSLLLCLSAPNKFCQRTKSAQACEGESLGAFSQIEKRFAFFLVAWVGIGIVVMFTATVSKARVRVVLAAMGHGCGVVVRTQNGRCLVYDAGRLGAGHAAARSLSAVLVSERIRTIDCLVLSHADADHFNAVPEIVERFRVRQLVVTPDFICSESEMVKRVLAAVEKKGIMLSTVSVGDELAIDPNCSMQVLHPGIGKKGTDNEKSIVLMVEAADQRLLLMGDLEGPALRQFLDNGPPRCDVVVAPHHGSHTGMSRELVSAIRPQAILVSGSGGRRWPSVIAAFREGALAPIPVLRTAGSSLGERGAIAVDFDRDRISISRFQATGWQTVDESVVIKKHPDLHLHCVHPNT